MGVYGELLICATIPRACRSCYDSEMRDLVMLFVHATATLGPTPGVRKASALWLPSPFSSSIAPGCFCSLLLLTSPQFLLTKSLACHFRPIGTEATFGCKVLTLKNLYRSYQ
jgi:hypothetical protein